MFALSKNTIVVVFPTGLRINPQPGLISSRFKTPAYAQLGHLQGDTTVF
jgi:hypothetical protein